LIAYCGGSLAAIAGTSTFQDALSGLQQLQTASQGFAFGGIGNLLGYAYGIRSERRSCYRKNHQWRIAKVNQLASEIV
jgi:hypothetical protein